MRRLLVIAAGAFVAVAAGCVGHVVAPAPPQTAPAVEKDTILPGHPLMIAVRAARVLTENQYRTRRFGGDSTWGYQSTDKIAVRFRYSQVRDSTRVRLQAWGPCDANGCVRGDADALIAQLAEDEPPPT